MKNPNGYGSVFKLGGNRRRPYCARVTVGWTDEGKQKYKNIGYFEERADALIALAQYNNDPYDLDSNRITFTEIYEKWSEEKFPKISKSNVYGHKAAYAKCMLLYNMKFKQIRKTHLQRIINENSSMSQQSRAKIKNLFLQMYKFAIENDVVDKNYAEFVEIGESTTTIDRQPFTNDEIQKLWDNFEIPYVDALLIMIYSGLRIGELLRIKCENIDVEKRIIVGGLKTMAGKNRAIPIHYKILPLIEKRMKHGEYLIMSPTNKKLSYGNYTKRYFKPILEKLNMNHLPHDCRHTAVTLMNNAEINPIIIKRIIGHASNDLTERVYTHTTHEQLVEAIDKIKAP